MDRISNSKPPPAASPTTKPIAWLGPLQFNSIAELAAWANAMGQLRAIMRQLTRRAP